MLAATLKGSFIMAMASGQLASGEPVEVEKRQSVAQEEALHYLLEVELFQGDDIIIRWI